MAGRASTRPIFNKIYYIFIYFIIKLQYNSLFFNNLFIIYRKIAAAGLVLSRKDLGPPHEQRFLLANDRKFIF